MIKLSQMVVGDVVLVIVVVVDMIDMFMKKLKWVCKIVLVMDGQGVLDVDDILDIVKKMNDFSI